MPRERTPRWAPRKRGYSIKQECPFCKGMNTEFVFRPGSQQLLEVNHIWTELNEQCTLSQWLRNPQAPKFKGVFNYEDLSDRMSSAQAYIRSQEAKERQPLKQAKPAEPAEQAYPNIPF